MVINLWPCQPFFLQSDLNLYLFIDLGFFMRAINVKYLSPCCYASLSKSK